MCPNFRIFESATIPAMGAFRVRFPSWMELPRSTSVTTTAAWTTICGRFEGQLNWPEFVRELVRSGFAGSMVFEALNPDFDLSREAQSRLEQLIDEASRSDEEFARKYGLILKNDDNDLH